MVNQDLDLSKIGPVVNIGVDLAKWDKKETEIELIELTQVPSIFTAVIEGSNPPVHYMQWVLKVSSKVLETIELDDPIKPKIEFRASELFSLVQDKKGNLTGFPSGEKAKIAKFCKDLKIDLKSILSLDKVIEQIKGKKVIIRSYEKEEDGNKNTYLAFRY